MVLFIHFNTYLQWVDNILEHKSEADRIVYEDSDDENGFVLLPDLKWNGTSVETLYLLAIVKSHGIKSLRDLGYEHLPLLKNILENGTVSIFIGYKKRRIFMDFRTLTTLIVHCQKCSFVKCEVVYVTDFNCS